MQIAANERNNSILTSKTVFDAVLLLYLCVTFVHQQETVVDTLLRYGSIGLLAFAGLLFLPAINHERPRGLVNPLILWFVVFFTYAMLSTLWAWDKTAGYSKLFEIAKVGVACAMVMYRVDTKEDLRQMLVLYLISHVYMVVMLVLRTPLYVWGTERIGEVIGLHSNQVGRYAATGFLLCLYMFTDRKTKKARFAVLMVPFVVIAMFTGSKNAILISIVHFVLYLFFTSNRKTRWLKCFAGVLFAAVLFYLIMTVDELYNIIGNRFEVMIDFLRGEQWDGSTSERLFFMGKALELFRQVPVVGSGIDNFAVYLARIGYKNAVYSHCGYLELLSTMGVIGAFLYYSVYFYMTGALIKCSTGRALERCLLLTLLIRLLIFDVVSISAYEPCNYIVLALGFVCVRCEKEVAYGDQR